MEKFRVVEFEGDSKRAAQATDECSVLFTCKKCSLVVVEIIHMSAFTPVGLSSCILQCQLSSGRYKNKQYM